MTTEQLIEGVYFSIFAVFFFVVVWFGLSLSQADDSIVFGRGLIHKQWLE